MFGPLITLAENLAANWLANAFGPTSMIGIGIALLMTGALVAYWHHQQRAAKKLGMASLPFIVGCVVVALFAVAAGAYGVGLRMAKPASSPSPAGATTSYIRPDTRLRLRLDPSGTQNYLQE
jgi:hypothetical protein